MDSSSRPVSERLSLRFGPAILARSVIALPLMEQIDFESAVIERFDKAYPKSRKGYNAAIFLHSAYPGGIDAALATLHANLLIAEKN